MPSLRSIFQRIIAPEPYGFNDPTLKDAFNKLAQSPFGRDSVEFCKNKGYEISVTDDLPPKTLATCSIQDIQARPFSTYGTLAHEMRHAYQMHALNSYQDRSGNPLLAHMAVRMTEADAFTYSSLVKISRWKDLGYDASEIIKHENDVQSIDLMAYAGYQLSDYDPRVLLEVLRQVFDFYYRIIAEQARGLDGYETTGMEAAEKGYKELDNLLKPGPERRAARIMTKICSALVAIGSLAGAWLPGVAIGVAGLIIQSRLTGMQEKSVEKKIAQYKNSAALIDGLAERLGKIPGLEGNYLTDTFGGKLSAPAYAGFMKEKVADFHKEWQGKIAEALKNRQPA